MLLTTKRFKWGGVWYERRLFVETMRENPSQMGGGLVMRALGNDDKQVVVAPCPSSSLMSLGGGSRVETAEKNHLRLAFGREGGDGGGRRVETPKITTSGSVTISTLIKLRIIQMVVWIKLNPD